MVVRTEDECKSTEAPPCLSLKVTRRGRRARLPFWEAHRDLQEALMYLSSNHHVQVILKALEECTDSNSICTGLAMNGLKTLTSTP